MNLVSDHNTGPGVLARILKAKGLHKVVFISVLSTACYSHNYTLNVSDEANQLSWKQIILHLTNFSYIVSKDLQCIF